MTCGGHGLTVGFDTAVGIVDDLVGALAADVSRARNLAAADLDLAHDLDRALAAVPTLAATALAAARDLAHRLDCASGQVRTLTLDLNRGFGGSLDLDRHLHDLYGLIRALSNDLGLAPLGAQTEAGRPAPVWPAARVAAAASGLLPGWGRPRYAEEYQAELADLAAAGAGRWRQLGHAGRLLVKAAPLRMALARVHRYRREVV